MSRQDSKGGYRRHSNINVYRNAYIVYPMASSFVGIAILCIVCMWVYMCYHV